MAIPVKIPCKKYLRDFLAVYFKNEIVTFDETSEDYLFIRSLICKQPIIAPTVSKFFDSYVTLLVPDYCFKEKLTFVGNSKAHLFHQRYYSLFLQNFCMYVNQHIHNPGAKIEPLIRQYMAIYQWTEEDVNIEMFRKAYQRHGQKKAKKNKVIFRWDTPPCPKAVLFIKPSLS